MRTEHVFEHLTGLKLNIALFSADFGLMGEA
jgi:hypothetical protein